MARVEGFRNIFQKVTGLIEGGMLPYEQRPIWYDVYAKYPPRLDPCSSRPPASTSAPVPLYYPEDAVRARFYATFGSPGGFNIADSNAVSVCQRFVDKFYENAQKNTSLGENELFESATKNIEGEGVVLRRIV